MMNRWKPLMTKTYSTSSLTLAPPHPSDPPLSLGPCFFPLSAPVVFAVHIVHPTAHLHLSSHSFHLTHLKTSNPEPIQLPTFLVPIAPLLSSASGKENQIRIILNTWFPNSHGPFCDLTVPLCFLSKITYSSYLKWVILGKLPNTSSSYLRLYSLF